MRTAKIIFPYSFLFISFFLIVVPVKSENGSQGYHFHRIEAASHIGFIWPHHPDLDNLFTGNFSIVQLAFSRLAPGNRPWHHTYNFPEMGITLIYSNLGYPQVLGQAFGLMPHVNLPLHRGRQVTYSLRYSAGGAILTNFYKDPDNLENLAISSPFNIAMNTTLQASFSLGKGFLLKGGLGITHFSNAKTSTPNKGLNIPSAVIELSGNIGQQPIQPLRLPNAELADRYDLSLYLAGGYTALYPPGGPAYGEFTLSSSFTRGLSAKSRLGMGTDVFFGLSDKAILENNGQAPPKLASLLKPGLHIAYEQVFSRTTLVVHQGVYIYAANQSDGRAYNRLGFRHRMSERWLLNLTLKSHLFRADFLEMGAGFKIL
jgi:hypothetical protein